MFQMKETAYTLLPITLHYFSRIHHKPASRRHKEETIFPNYYKKGRMPFKAMLWNIWSVTISNESNKHCFSEMSNHQCKF